MRRNERPDTADDLGPVLRALKDARVARGSESDQAGLLREGTLSPESRKAALEVARSAMLDGQLARAGRRIGPPAPDEALGQYLERVRTTAGISAERWASRLGIPPEVLERVFTTRRGVLSLRPAGWAVVLDALNLPVEVLRRSVFSAAALLGSSPARGAGGADPRIQATVQQFVEQVETTLRDRDREDLVG